MKETHIDALPHQQHEALPEIGQQRPINFTIAPAGRQTLFADVGDLRDGTEQAWELLRQSNEVPWLFRYAGIPTWVVPDDEGRPVTVSLNEDRLRPMFARLARWVRTNHKGDVVPAAPPLAVIRAVLATPDPALPVLIGIVNTPVIGRNGKLLTTPGYHPDARLLYCPAPGFDVAAPPECPSRQEIKEAKALICEELFGDFPFVSPAELAHAVALLLIGFVRPMIDGPTPLHLIEKPTPGTGATLMVDVIATILTGSGASVMTEGSDDEMRKRITAKLRQVPSILLIDNLRKPLDSSALAAALTAPFWEDRILGMSEMARLPIRCTWVATGNNPVLSNEISRRVVRIRLDAHVERPWKRDGFHHPDLMIWVRANRACLVGACLILCQAWIAAGRPAGRRTIGSYENWARVVGGILECAGIDGFLGNLEEMMEASDIEGAAWHAFVAGWWQRHGSAKVKVSDLHSIALLSEQPLDLGGGNDLSQRTRLGKALARMRDRIFDVAGRRIRLEALGVYQQAMRWRLAVLADDESKLSRLRCGEVDRRAGRAVMQSSSAQPPEPIGFKEGGEVGEVISTLAYTRTHDTLRKIRI